MTNLYFEELMQEFGCTVAEGVAFGAVDGYPYNVEQEGGTPSTLVFRFAVNGSTKPAVSELKSREIEHLKWFAEEDDASGLLVCVFSPPSDFYAKAGIHTALAAAVQALRANNLHAPDACPLCGTKNCDAYAFLEDGYRATHGACLRTRLDLPEKDAVPKATLRGNYFTGALGALLGAIIAVVPNWAQALTKGQVNVVLYAFIPLLSALVYRLFRGKSHRAYAGAAVLVASLVASFMMELFWYWLVLTDLWGRNVSFWQSIQTYFATHSLPSSVQEMAFSLLFLLVGYFASLIFIRRYTAGGEQQGRIQRGRTFVQASAQPTYPSEPLTTIEQNPPLKGEQAHGQPPE